MIWKPHATVAAIIEREGKFLMVEEDIEGEIVYNQPAGHLDPGESLIEAAIRETQEETAWRFKPEALVGIYLWPQPETDRTFLRFAFCGSCSDHQIEQPLDTGIIRALWMSREELQDNKKLRSPMVIQNIDDYLAGQRYPLQILSTVDYQK
ncbi:MAG: NUDIX hydrolase [Gammaproteobacteria bacterium]|nr:NUDIX hydrolase [Gammaproteobacteria bacterium]